MFNKQEFMLAINPHNLKIWVILIQYTLALAGLLILVSCIYFQGNPFPYANYLGLFIFFLAIALVTLNDKTPWPKQKPKGDEFDTNYGP